MKDKNDFVFSSASPASRVLYRLRRFAARTRQIIVRRRVLVMLFVLVLLYHYLSDSGLPFLPRFHWGSSRFVIILAVNQGGGVMQWKGAKEWAVERTSIANKKAYADRHGYDLAIQDMSIKKRYAHEWRESWEKVDVIRSTMKQYPKAEWFWWLDLHTYIMEPDVSLERHVFNKIENNTYRSLSVYNPMNLPVSLPYVDNTHDINLVVPQDCGGFNLGSFFIRRSEWTDFLLDVWWDPVFYEQRHMQWEHKEQDALEHMYSNQPWIRSGVSFIPQRLVNSFPAGACAEQAGDPRIFYDEKDRDFVVNMAGCEWGRDCFGEMEHFQKLSASLQQQNKKWLPW
ncbi:galactosyl transferase GMA12/MNN10 family-domain-containing protein [Kockiozyma suomiensis]|uniref:galactosyl transferase GMA12/MNN10 family-domain-containing protein n=1 Tax=Kockiozyma suomiensis TaxID=1337062 RepID=UPI0033431181